MMNLQIILKQIIYSAFFIFVGAIYTKSFHSVEINFEELAIMAGGFLAFMSVAVLLIASAIPDNASFGKQLNKPIWHAAVTAAYITVSCCFGMNYAVLSSASKAFSLTAMDFGFGAFVFVAMFALTHRSE